MPRTPGSRSVTIVQITQYASQCMRYRPQFSRSPFISVFIDDGQSGVCRVRSKRWWHEVLRSGCLAMLTSRAAYGSAGHFPIHISHLIDTHVQRHRAVDTRSRQEARDYVE